jgi:hypothetical protein
MLIISTIAATLPAFSQAPRPKLKSPDSGHSAAFEFVRTYVERSKIGPDKSTRVAIARVPRTRFYVAYLQASTWCGSGGCTLLILKSAGASYEVAGKVTTVWEPIVYLGAKGGGAPAIGVWVHGGGILKAYEAALIPREGRYPASPSVSGRRVPAGVGLELVGRNNRSVALFD